MPAPRFNPPPNWPPLPSPDWQPPENWRIPPTWKVPPDWPLWVDHAGRPVPPPDRRLSAAPPQGRSRRTAAWAAGGLVGGLVLGSVLTPSSGDVESAVPALPTTTATATVTATATAMATATATATATVTAAVDPAPTKTVRVRTTVTAKPKPRPTVTRTVYRDNAAPDDSSDNVYYDTCSDARAAGDTPLYRGDPGYDSHLDRDGDGVACE